MRVAIGSDHGGYELKENLKIFLENKGISYLDFGTNSLDSVDYPDYAKKVSQAVLTKDADFGILVCGTGIGISIAANKINGIRAALVYDQITARLSKEHNNANVIALGGRTTSKENAYLILDAYLDASYEMRHQKRLDKIHQLEEK